MYLIEKRDSYYDEMFENPYYDRTTMGKKDAGYKVWKELKKEANKLQVETIIASDIWTSRYYKTRHRKQHHSTVRLRVNEGLKPSRNIKVGITGTGY
jgi:hypothetical protein